MRIQQVRLADLPPNWRELPAPEFLQNIGNVWILGQPSAVLAVPSAVIPQENNYLLNPAHPHLKRIQIGRPAPFSIDLRII